MQTIFISKNEDEVGELRNFCTNNNFNLIAASGISITYVDFEEPKGYDVLFFGSKHSVHAYFKCFSSQNKILACAGIATANVLKTYGFDANYIADTANEKDWKKFNDWLADSTAFFPSSQVSLHSFSTYLQKEKHFYAISYLTNETKFDLIHSNADVHVFTSPSNVRAFASTFKDQKLKTVIAWGESTAKETEKLLHFESLLTLEKPTMQELILLLSESI